MARRVGIELSPSRCAIVDIDVPADRSRQAARIRTFRTIPWSAGNAEAFVATLRLLRASKMVPDRAIVALWGVRSASHVARLAPGQEADPRAVAPEGGTSLPEGTETASAVLFDDPASHVPGAPREAAVVVVPVVDVRSRLAPLIAAGFTIEAAVTVPLALASVSRLLHRHPGDTVRAYLAVNADATAVAIVRNGLLLFAREIPIAADTTILDAGAGETAVRSSRAEFTIRLGAELKRSLLLFRQQTALDVARVFICGELPNLRALTAPLIHILNVEVETLDSMEGLASGPASASGDDVSARTGELRVAWAVATDRASTANLVSRDAAPRRERIELARRSVAAVAAGCMLVAGSYLFARGWERHVEARSGLLRQEISLLEPQIQEAERARSERGIDTARASALEWSAAHGPRLARILEVLGRSAPRDVVLESARVVPNDDVWRLSMTGKASGSTPADAQAAFNEFLRLASASTLLGQPVEVPSMSVAATSASQARLHFTVVFEVRR
jgi:hypothetical protein